MWKRLPRWMWMGGLALAFLAGMVNVVGLMEMGQAVTHMTGLTTRAGERIAEGRAFEMAQVLGIMVSFVVGAALSGVMIGDSVLQWGRRYEIALSMEAIFLAVAGLLVGKGFLSGFYLAALACGLQNAMASSFSGSAIRTTHLSGMYTDLGISLGLWIRRMPVDPVRMWICISTITGFLGGGVVGAVLMGRIGTATLYVAAGMALGLAIVYGVMLRVKRWRVQVEVGEVS